MTTTTADALADAIQAEVQGMNKCVICGRFRKWEDLVGVWEPDTDFGPERGWYECKPCRKKEADYDAHCHLPALSS